MQKNTKNNKYKFQVGDYAYVIYDEQFVIELKVEKRLKRPYRLSDNFYFCSWTMNGRHKNGIRYEEEMFKTFDAAIEYIENSQIK